MIARRRPRKFGCVMRDVQIFDVPLLTFKRKNMVYIYRRVNGWLTARINSFFHHFIEKVTYFFKWLLIPGRIEVPCQDLN